MRMRLSRTSTRAARARLAREHRATGARRARFLPPTRPCVETAAWPLSRRSTRPRAPSATPPPATARRRRAAALAQRLHRIAGRRVDRQARAAHLDVAAPRVATAVLRRDLQARHDDVDGSAVARAPRDLRVDERETAGQPDRRRRAVRRRRRGAVPGPTAPLPRAPAGGSSTMSAPSSSSPSAITWRERRSGHVATEPLTTFTCASSGPRGARRIADRHVVRDHRDARPQRDAHRPTHDDRAPGQPLDLGGGVAHDRLSVDRRIDDDGARDDERDRGGGGDRDPAQRPADLHDAKPSGLADAAHAQVRHRRDHLRARDAIDEVAPPPVDLLLDEAVDVGLEARETAR